jgi:hypothetical protein
VTAILEAVLAQFTPEVSRQISRQLGVDQQTVQRAILAALPLLVAAMARNASDPRGASSLSNALARDHDGSILQDVPGAVRGYQDQPGEGILKHVLGDQRRDVGNALTEASGADGSALLQMLAPIVMGVLGDMQRQQNLNSDSLASTLGQEREQLTQTGGVLPAEMLPGQPVSSPQSMPERAAGPPEPSDILSDLLGRFLR